MKHCIRIKDVDPNLLPSRFILLVEKVNRPPYWVGSNSVRDQPILLSRAIAFRLLSHLGAAVLPTTICHCQVLFMVSIIAYLSWYPSTYLLLYLFGRLFGYCLRIIRD